MSLMDTTFQDFYTLLISLDSPDHSFSLFQSLFEYTQLR